MFRFERNHYHQEIIKNIQSTSVLVVFALKFREILLIILCFVDRFSRYKRVKINQLDAQLILSTFICVIPAVSSNTIKKRF